jgi:hypothetical protein
LAVYPADTLVEVSGVIGEYGSPGYRTDHLVLAFVFASTAVGLWKRRRWSYRLAVVLTGFATPVLLLAALGTLGEPLVHPPGVVFWRAFPFEAALDVLLPISTGIALLQLLRPSVQGAVAGGAGLVSLFRAAAAAFGIAVLLMALVAVFGLGAFGARWYQDALLLAHTPGILLLTSMGFCCGYRNGLVLSDVLDPHWGGLTPLGIPILTTANAAGLLLLLLLVRRTWYAWRSFRGGGGRALRAL